MQESEDEFILFESYNSELEKIVILDNDEHSVWAFVMDNETQEIEFDGFVCSISEPFSSEKEVEKLLDEGFAPAITTEYAGSECVMSDILEKEFSAVWHDSGYLEISINDNTHVIMDLEEQITYSRAIGKDGPYGLSLNDSLCEELLTEEGPEIIFEDDDQE